MGNRAGEATTLRNVAVSYRNQGEPEQALTQVNAAIAIIEDMRASFTNTDFKASYFSTVQGYYQLKVDILMQLGQSEAAFNTSERSRARSLVDLLNQSHIDLSTSIDDPELKTLIQEAQSQGNRI